MSNQKIVRYNLDVLEKENCDFNLIIGEKGNGKSYQVKHKRGVLKYLLQNNRRFIYLRRLREEISTEKVEQYFADVDVQKITNGKYNCITMYKKQLFLSNYDFENSKTVRGEKIGYVMALSTEQNYSGCSYLDVDDIIFEEFMSRTEYLYNEPNKLMYLYSTVDRKQRRVKVWMLGNTVSRVCPYVQEWGLDNIIFSMKQGTIEKIDIPTDSVDVNGNEVFIKLGIEYCKSTGVSSFVFGNAKNLINKGGWQADPQPTLPKSLNEYKSVFRFMFYYQSFKFLCRYLWDKTENVYCWFICPYYGTIDDRTLVVTDKVSPSRYWVGDIYNTRFPNERINNLLKTFVESKIFYSTDLCGTEFKRLINFMIKK